jgi:hypothetical protein
MVIGRRAFNDMTFELTPGQTATTRRSGDWGQTTATFRLWETANNAWGVGRGLDATFSVPAGVVIEAASVTYSHRLMGVNTAAPVSSGTIATERTYLYDTPHDQDTVFAQRFGMTVRPNELRLNPSFDTFTGRTERRFVDVTLTLSIEAGFESKNGDAAVDVFVSGPSVANLVHDRADNGLTVANAFDPISVSTSITPVSVTNPAYNVNVIDIDNIVITEERFGALQRGNEIWVYVIGNRAAEVEFTADMRATVSEDSELRLGPGRVLRHRWSNTWVNGMSWTVEAESRTRGSNEPAVITITGGKITGPIFPGVDYQIVVSGNAVARNDYTVFENTAGTGGFSEALNNRWRLFDAAPYAESVVEFDESTSFDLVPPPAQEIVIPDPVIILPSASLLLGPQSPPVNGIVPFILTDGNVGRVSLRVFSDFFFGPDAAVWDEATNTATVTGVNSLTGEETVVSFTNGSTNIVVNGDSFDIATFGGSNRPQGSVSVVNEGGRIYLPARSLADAFNINVQWNDQTKTATFTR